MDEEGRFKDRRWRAVLHGATKEKQSFARTSVLQYAQVALLRGGIQ